MRKKYIKALMALDVSRNDANAYALLCQLVGRPYATDYARRAPGLRLVKAARKVTVSMRMVTSKFSSSVAVAAAAMNRLAKAMAEANLQLHHPTPYTPENVADGLHHNMQIVTKAEHDAIHGRLDGYNAGTVIFDELEGQGGGGA